MALVDINFNPGEKKLLQFGMAAAIMSVVVAVLLYLLKDLSVKWCIVIVALGFVIFLCSRISIKVTKAIYISLIMLTFPIGMAVSFTVLAIFYYLLLTPVGLFFRLIKRDPLRRDFNQPCKTYWLKHRKVDNIKRYFQQF